MKECYRRSRIFIDKPVQTAVLIRAAWYWAACLVAQLLMAVFFATVNSTANDPKLWWHLQVTLLAALVLLPIILFDLLKLSHRWVGPIFRLRETLRALGRDEVPRVVRFREHDFWQELATDLNNVSAELARHRANATRASNPVSPSDSGDDLTTPISSDVRSQSSSGSLVI